MATQKDTLITEFKVVDQAAVQSIDNYYKKLDNTAAKLSDVEKRSADAALAVRSNFEKALNASLTQTHNLSQELRNLQNQPIGRGLDAAIQRATVLRTRIQEIRTAAATTKDATVLDGLINDARTAQKELDELDAKVRRVTSGRSTAAEQAAGGGISRAAAAGRLNLARQGADVFTGLASGQSPGMIAVQQGPQILDAMAQSGIKLSAAMAATAISVGAIAAVGVVIVALTSEARKDAEAYLKNVEKVQGAINKAILDQKKAVDGLAEARRQGESDREFARDLAKGDVEDLKRQRDLLEQIFNMDPTGGNAERNQQRIIAIDAQLEQIEAKKTAAADAAFEKRHEQFLKEQADEKKRAEDREESVKKGVEKLKEYGETAQGLFGGLFAAQGENNPFVKVFTDAEKAIEKTRITTALLSDELKATAEQMTATANANRLFGTRLDNNLRASDLRADADRFRGGGGSSPAEILAALQAGGVHRNEQLFFSSFGAGRRLDSFNALREMEQAGGLFRNPDFDNQIRRSLADSEPSARERFNRQLDVVKSLQPQNEEQRAIADRKIIELSRGLNPDDLTAQDRDAVATALENEAVRAENAEKDAKEKEAARDKINESINKNIEELLNIAKKDGLTGVIRIINEAENQAKVSLGKRPTESDMQSRTQ